jgi:hypothetical protein
MRILMDAVENDLHTGEYKDASAYLGFAAPREGCRRKLTRGTFGLG